MKNQVQGIVRQGFGKMVKGVSEFLLKEDELSDTMNMTPGFRWEQRKGMTALTSSAVAGSSPVFQTCFQYRKADQTEDMLVAHIFDTGSFDKIYVGSALPPNAITWTALHTMTTGCYPTQFATVGNALLWANGDDFGIYRGTSYKPSGIFLYDSSLTKYHNVWENGVDGDATTLIQMGGNHAAGDGLIIITPMPIDSITITIGTANTETTAAFSIDDFNGAWGSVTASDGTASGGASLAQTGSITWTGSADVIPTNINGIFGFGYRLKWSTGALSAGTTISEIRVTSDPASVKDVPFGQWSWCSGCYFYTGDTGGSYEDYIGYVNNDVQSLYVDLADLDQSDNACLYVAFPTQVNVINFTLVPTSFNDQSSTMTISYRNEDSSWDSVSNQGTDGTSASSKTLSNSGSISWQPPTDEAPHALLGDTFEQYWYKITFSADLGTSCQIYAIRGIAAPDNPKPCRGVASWKNRAWQVGPTTEPNALRYSAYKLPNVWNGIDSGWLVLGDRPLVRAIPFYNEMVAFADTEMWMIQGNTPASFAKMRLSSKIGTDAPMSVVPIDVGVHAGGGDHLKICLVWKFYDGFYMFDGIKWFKISAPDIDNFFDPTHADYINPAKAHLTYGEFDFETQCAMWVVYSGSSQTSPNKVIVLHFPTMRYGVYDYESVDTSSGVTPQSICNVHNSTTGRYYTVGGGYNGKFYLLNSGNSDIDASNNTEAVDAWITSRAIWIEDGDGAEIRDINILIEQEDTGMVELELYPDGSSTPQLATRQKMQNLGKSVKQIVYKPKTWGKNIGTRIRLRNRSAGVRMVPLQMSIGVDKTRGEE